MTRKQHLAIEIYKIVQIHCKVVGICSFFAKSWHKLRHLLWWRHQLWRHLISVKKCVNEQRTELYKNFWQLLKEQKFNPRSLGGGMGGQIDLPSIFLALNFCSLTDCQKLLHSCSLFVNTSFDTN